MLIIGTAGYGYSKTRCIDVVMWFMKNHMPNHKITIDVIHRGLKREFFYGCCTVEDCNYRPRSFLIEIQSNLDKTSYIYTLLHELQHVFQHVRGDLKDRVTGSCWKGINYKNTPYDELPWEIEAMKMEKVLYDQYIKDMST